MRPRLVVTGASGRLGGRVSRLHAAAGVPARYVVRDPARGPDAPGEVSVAAYHDGAAFDGAETVLLVSASESADREAVHRAVVDAAVAVGVRRVVYTSFPGAARDATFAHARLHAATEEHLRSSGLGTVFVEDAVLLDPGPHEDRVYELTGPAALTLDEVAGVLSRAEGRDVRYVEETLEQAHASRAHHGTPDWEVDAWVSTYTAIAAGEMARVTDDVEGLTGHRPRSLEETLAGPAGRGPSTARRRD